MAPKTAMKYTRLGKSGLTVSQICLGCMSYGDNQQGQGKWFIEENEALPVINEAYKAGINFFDTANVYSNGVSEKILGKAIKKYKFDRSAIVVATKVYNVVARNADPTGGKSVEELDKMGYVNQRGLSRKHIFDSVKASLERLDLEYIDLLQIHRFDKYTPVKETMQALHDVVQTGMVRYIGCSSMWAHEFLEMQYCAKAHGWMEFISMQNHYNAAYREEEREMFPAMKKFGTESIPWAPVGGGFLTRPHEKYASTARGQGSAKERLQHEKEVNDAIGKVAKKRGVSMAEVAIAWCLHKPGVASPIVGCSTAERVHEACAALDLKLSQQEMKEIEAPYKPMDIVGHF